MSELLIAVLALYCVVLYLSLAASLEKGVGRISYLSRQETPAKETGKVK